MAGNLLRNRIVLFVLLVVTALVSCSFGDGDQEPAVAATAEVDAFIPIEVWHKYIVYLCKYLIS